MHMCRDISKTLFGQSCHAGRVCCSVLQCVLQCGCSVLQGVQEFSLHQVAKLEGYVVVCCSACYSVCYSVCCNVCCSLCCSVCCSVLQRIWRYLALISIREPLSIQLLQYDVVCVAVCVAVCCSVLMCIAVFRCCSVLQCIWT